MSLQEKTITELAQILEEDFGQKLNTDQVSLIATELVSFFSLLTKVNKKSENHIESRSVGFGEKNKML